MQLARTARSFRAVVLAILLAATGLPLLATPASAATSSVGNAVGSRPNLDTADSALYMNVDTPVSTAGYLDAFVYHADRAGTLRFVVMAPGGSPFPNRVQYVSPAVPVTVGVGIYKPAAPIAVTPGAVIGFHTAGQNPIGFDVTSGTPRQAFANYPMTAPVVGQVIAFNFQSPQPRAYSFEAAITPATFSSSTVTVPANVYKYNSGVVLAAGESVSLSATGTWNIGAGYNAGPDGNASRFSGGTVNPSIADSALLGSVDGTAWSLVGNGPVTFSGPGTLRFTANDSDTAGVFGDNFGSMTVTVSRRLSVEELGTDASWTSVYGGSVNTCAHPAWVSQSNLSPATYIWRDPEWWNGCNAPDDSQAFTKTFAVPAGAVVTGATVAASIDNSGTVSVNGSPVLSVSGFTSISSASVSPSLITPGATNTIRVDATNACCGYNPAGAAARLSVTHVGAPQTVSFTSTAPSTGHIGGTYVPATVGGASGKPVTLAVSALSTPGACTFDGSTVRFTGGGVCAVTADQDAGGFYAPARPAYQLIKVLYAQTIAFAAIPQHRIGDAFTVTATGGASGSPVTFTGGPSSVCSVTSGGLVSAVATGTCVITANQAGGTWYEAATAAQQSFSIIPKVPTITSISPTSGPTSGGGTLTVNGTNLTDGSIVGGVCAGVTEVVSSTTVRCTIASGTHGTVVNVTVTTPGGTSGSKPFTYLGTATVVPDAKTITYGDPLPTFTSSILNLPAGATVVTQPTCDVTGSPTTAGQYPITCSGAVVTGAFIDQTQTATLTIAKRGVTITPAGTQTYGGTPTITYSVSGTLPGDGVSGTLTCGVKPTPTTPVGTAAISGCSGLTVSNASQYALTYAPGTATVSPAPLHVTASSSTTTYGDAVPAVTAAYAGFVNGEGPAVLAVPAGCTTAASATADAGTYPTQCAGVVAANYLVDYAGGTATITKAQLTVTGGDGTKVYGADLPAITAAYDGFRNGQTAADLATPATCSPTAAASSGVGTYSTTCSGATSGNYTFDYVPGTFTVTPAPLSVFASSAQLFEHDSVPSITAVVAGLVNGDDDSIVECSTTATSASAAGTYPTTCVVDSGDYEVFLTEGTVTVLSVGDVIGDVAGDIPGLGDHMTDMFEGVAGNDELSSIFDDIIDALEAGDDAAAADLIVDLSSTAADLFLSGDLSVEDLTAIFTNAGIAVASLDGGILTDVPAFADPDFKAAFDADVYAMAGALPGGLAGDAGRLFLDAQIALVAGDAGAAVDAFNDLTRLVGDQAATMDPGALSTFFEAAGPINSMLGDGLLQQVPAFADPGFNQLFNGYVIDVASGLPAGFSGELGAAFIDAQVALVAGDVDAAVAAMNSLVTLAAADPGSLTVQQLTSLFTGAGPFNSLLGNGLVQDSPQFANPDFVEQFDAVAGAMGAALPNGFSDDIGQAFLAAQVALVAGDSQAAADAITEMVTLVADHAATLDPAVLSGLFTTAGPFNSLLGHGLLQTAPQFNDPSFTAYFDSVVYGIAGALPTGFTGPVAEAFLDAQVALVAGDVDGAIDAMNDLAAAAAADASSIPAEQLLALFKGAGPFNSLLGDGLLQDSPQFADPAFVARFDQVAIAMGSALPNGFSDEIGQAFLDAQLALVAGDSQAAVDSINVMIGLAADQAATLDPAALTGLFTSAGPFNSLLGHGLLQEAPQFADPAFTSYFDSVVYGMAAGLPAGFTDGIGSAFIDAQVALIAGDVDGAITAVNAMVGLAADAAADGALSGEQLLALFKGAGPFNSLLGDGLLQDSPQFADPAFVAAFDQVASAMAAALPGGFGDEIGQAYLAAQVALVEGDSQAATDAINTMIGLAADQAATLDVASLTGLFTTAGPFNSMLGHGLLQELPQFADPAFKDAFDATTYALAGALPGGFGDDIGAAFIDAQVALIAGDVDGAVDAINAMTALAASHAAEISPMALAGIIINAGPLTSMLGDGLLQAAPAIGNPTVLEELNSAHYALGAAIEGTSLGGSLLAASVAEVAGDVVGAKAALDGLVADAVAAGLPFPQLVAITSSVATIERILGSTPQVLSFGAAGAAVYGGSYVPTAGGGGSGSPVVLTIDSSSASVCSLAGGVVHFDHVGVCTVNATQAGADGFAPAVPVQQSVTVTPAALTITADAKSMTYGSGSVPALTATFAGLVGDDTPSSVTGLALATAPASSHVGTYAITAGGATSPDYAITFVPGVLTIVRAPLTVTAVDAVRLYDVANPVFAATATGLVNGDTLASAFGSSLVGSSPAVPVSNVGTYPITFTGVAPDYSVTFVGGTLTVKPMPTTVTFTSSATQPAGPTYLSVHVVEAVGGAPVRGGSVAFTAGSLSSTVATSAAGVATTSLSIPNGIVTVTAAYSGANYVASSASQGLTSFLSTQFVVWGGNSPAGVVAGGTYRFWGSAWKDQVTAGAYGAGDSFKGYAEVVAADGRSFTARTGSSGSAPASIARYISVLVSTSMTKAGSTISGNVVQRVVLRVDDLSTYKPSAGGTTAGVLVATVA